MSNENLSADELEEIERLMAELEADAAAVAAAPEETTVAAVEDAPVEAPAAVKEPEPEPVAEVPEPAPAVESEDQDRKSYTDDQDREGYTAEAKPAPEVEKEQSPTTERRIQVGQTQYNPFGEKKEPAPGPALQFYVDADQFRRDTAVSDTRLDNCMIEQNGLRAFYGVQAARAEAQYSRLKVRFEVLEAALYDEQRKKLASAGEKVTEKMVETAVKTDARWLRMKNTVIEAESIAAINKALVFSLVDRRDMIIQLAADRRDEMRGQARMMEREDLVGRASSAAALAMGKVAA